jgi:NADPH2:quinone reductase
MTQTSNTPLPARIRKIVVQRFGDASELTLQTAEMPKPGPGEVLVRVAAAGVNFSDILRRRNTYFMPTPLPFVPGAEAVGEIVAMGPQAPSPETDQDNQGQNMPPPLAQGMRVLAILPAGGGYADFALAPAAYCVPLPTGLDSMQATALFVQGSTAQLLLTAVAAPALGGLEGKTLLITAAAGGVGSLLVQLAQQAGARVMAAVGSVAKQELVGSLGINDTFCYADANWTQQVLARNEGQPVDLFLDPVGGKVYEQCFAALKPGGTGVVYGSASATPGLMDSEHLVNQGQSLLSFNLAHQIQQHPQRWQAALGAVIGQAAQSSLRIPVTHTFSLADAASAHRSVEARQTSGKVVLLP